MKSIHFLSNVVVNPIQRKIEHLLGVGFSVSVSDVNQVERFLLSKRRVDVLIIILSSKYFFNANDYDQIDEKLDLLFSLINGYREKNKTDILLSNLWDTSSSVTFQERDKGENNFRIVAANRKILGYASQEASVQVLNFYELVRKIGQDNFYRLKMDLLYQMPFSSLAICSLTEEVMLKLNLLDGRRKKICLVDGDNTLWGGILGEDGIQGVACDQNYPGVVYWAFQKQLLELKRTGVVLGLVSKNNKEDILSLFQARNFPLKIDDFSILLANWETKSINIQSAATHFNVGLDSVVFIDDSDFEIEGVQMALPEVLCIQFDLLNLEKNLSLLASIPSLQATSLTTEDVAKAEQYRQEGVRKDLRQIFNDVESYVRSLDVKIECSINNPKNLQRVVQLFNKTNQFNLTTIRYQAAEIEEIYKKGFVFDFKVEDKFGDMGIVGVAIVVNNRIMNFALSCRALGRDIEFKIIAIIREIIGNDVKSNFILSSKNHQTENFYEKCGFEVIQSHKNEKKYRFYKGYECQNKYDYIQYEIVHQEV